MLNGLQEASSVLSQLKQITPSDRSNVSGTEGTGDRSEVGRSPSQGQKKIWGNLDTQSRGMEGNLDTQGKTEPELFTSHKGNSSDNSPGTFTPPKYKSMLQIKESATAEETGVDSGKHKTTSAANTVDPTQKNVQGADTNPGGSCNCGEVKKSTITEEQVVGSTVAMIAAQALIENYKISFNFRKNGK